MTSGTPQVRSDFRTIEDRVLDALHSSIEKWGLDKVTIDDVAQVSGVSRATIYRMFPGGREVLFEALRVRNLNEFFTGLRSAVDSSASLLDLVVAITVHATRELRGDEQLVAMLANEEAGVLRDLTVDGLPRIISVASSYLRPLFDDYLPREASGPFVDLLARLVISHFLAPSDHVDLSDRDSARQFLVPLVTLIEPVTEGATS
ncbi:MAG: TetR family transcriptional regulator [Ilumatobacteraceae bacterium]